MALKVLSALDLARTQFYHFKAIIITGMGLFTDAYDLFSIPLAMMFIGRIYYEKRAEKHDKYVTPPIVVSIMAAIALVGTVIGQVVFGRLGDIVGRRRVYGIALMIMVLSSIGCGFSICTTRSCVLVILGLFRALGSWLLRWSRWSFVQYLTVQLMERQKIGRLRRQILHGG
ncbi:hypothetical protein CMV_003779 [Castanea mollissima]|uniref:Major facilitator superfamily (MFS) profile domain-containing protein n=1 Tax=Castanea mollissima TaxID=60419 RepID=A0A8J4RSN0_9ROSI|nr:hypothetical protein CMV_003779 [Castanea mollissima]